MSNARAALRAALPVCLALSRVLADSADVAAPGDDRLTFNQHIAPIVSERCAPCHRAGGPAPFPLVTYEDVRKRAAQIAQVTRDRYMPPWLPDPGEVPFIQERRLSSVEIDRISQWVAQGAVEGEQPISRHSRHSSADWQLGPPDLIVSMQEPFLVPAEGPDLYRNFVLPVRVNTRRFVAGVDVRPGVQGVIHHAVLAVDRTRSSRYRDRADPRPGYDLMFPAQAESPDGHFVGWTPGKQPLPLSHDTAWRLDRGNDLVLQLHLTPSGKPESVQVRIGLYFAERPPSRTPFMLRVGSKALAIPAGERAYTATDAFVLPVDVELHTIYPHAHFLARSIDVSAKVPRGRLMSLIRIRNWDFNWQDEYRFAEPILLPRGTVISARFIFDNSAANPRNPHTPPRLVTYGPRATDEMGDVWLQVVPRNASDLAKIRARCAEHELRQNIAGYEMTVRAHPVDAIARAQLGTFYFFAGRRDAAIAQYRRALDLQPRLWLAHYNLGVVLQAGGRFVDAVEHFEQAVASEPQHAESHHAWGQALESRGRPREAVAHYQEALRLWPEYADVLNSWGNLLVRERRVDEAMARYRAALAIQPEHVPALNNLGLALVREGRLDDAVRMFEQAVGLDPEHPSSGRNLREALARQRERVKR